MSYYRDAATANLQRAGFSEEQVKALTNAFWDIILQAREDRAKHEREQRDERYHARQALYAKIWRRIGWASMGALPPVIMLIARAAS